MNKYDTIIIGSGMSGLAAGIRLAHFGKKVLICEKHSISGGLNSYYKRNGKIFDVGLHAMTNYVLKTNKKAPLNKLLRQLRMKWDDLCLVEQKRSVIKFLNKELYFSNNIELLKQEIAEKFKKEQYGFSKLVEFIKNYDSLSLTNRKFFSARKKIKEFIKNDLLIEMLMCPLMYYGSAWENDMDISQFAIMFNSIFLEGFCRPENGVIRIINMLEKKYLECRGKLIFNSGVSSILTLNKKIYGVKLENNEELIAENVLSSAGICETYNLIDKSINNSSEHGKLSFTEIILELKKNIPNYENTIMFYNNSNIFKYRMPDKIVNLDSFVLCSPDNFQYNEKKTPIIRITNMANSKLWENCSIKEYKEKKEYWYNEIVDNISKIIPLNKENIIFKDMFTPKTVKRYTGHINGAVYGSPDKIKSGRTEIENLFICGTDQGFLGIIGAMLSGISIANMYLLK